MPDPQPNDELDLDDYDEFQFLEGHARWAGLEWKERPSVSRVNRSVNGRTVSFLRWGIEDPELVLLHGAGQNAHSWDTFAMAVERPAIAIDLPGHGHSDWRPDQDYSPAANALAVGEILELAAPRARTIVGMSLGGLTAIRLAASNRPAVVSLVLIDITPSPPLLDLATSSTPIGLLAGPRQFESWQGVVDVVHGRMPHRDRESIIPGVRHNVVKLDDGRWGWRYDRFGSEDSPRPDFESLWDDLATADVTLMLVKGGHSEIVTETALTEFRRRLPTARIEVIAESGHSIQSDTPVELAALVNGFIG